MLTLDIKSFEAQETTVLEAADTVRRRDAEGRIAEARQAVERRSEQLAQRQAEVARLQKLDPFDGELRTAQGLVTEAEGYLASRKAELAEAEEDLRRLNKPVELPELAVAAGFRPSDLLPILGRLERQGRLHLVEARTLEERARATRIDSRAVLAVKPCPGAAERKAEVLDLVRRLLGSSPARAVSFAAIARETKSVLPATALRQLAAERKLRFFPAHVFETSAEDVASGWTDRESTARPLPLLTHVGLPMTAAEEVVDSFRRLSRADQAEVRKAIKT